MEFFSDVIFRDEVIYSCDCGETFGLFYEKMICPVCKTEVKKIAN